MSQFLHLLQLLLELGTILLVHSSAKLWPCMIVKNNCKVCQSSWQVHCPRQASSIEASYMRWPSDVLQVFAQRRSYLNKLLNYEDEILALLALLLDSQSLASGSASFADSLYGLRRAPSTQNQESHPSKPLWLSQRQQRLALLSLVGDQWLYFGSDN